MSRLTPFGRVVASLFTAALLFSPRGGTPATAAEPAAEPATLGPETNPLWLRYPAVSPDGKDIAFVFRGHIFRVPTSGGEAVAITAGPAHQTAPVWSPDGKYLAFASDDYGNYDLFLVSAQGGAVRRLTDHSADEIPTGFTPDGHYVLFSAHRMNTAQAAKFPLGRILPELYRVSIAGNREPEQILTTPALGAHYDRAGQRLVYEDVKGYEDPWRKHETFAIAHDVWLYDAASGDHTQLTTFAGEDRNPVWAADERSVFYLSEQGGSFNVWRLPLDGNRPGTPAPVTHFEKNPVRFLSAANDGTLCFGYDGEIYTMPPGATEPQKVAIAITLASEGSKVANRTMSDGVTEIALSPNGKEIACVIRGDVFVSSVEHGDTKRITNTPGQERSVSFSPDGRRLVFAAEYGKPWALYEATIVAPKEKEPYFYSATTLDVHPLLENAAENFQPAYSPDGKEVAYLENRTTLKVMNLETKVARVILPGDRNYSYSDGDQWYEWSPDGKWFLVNFVDRNRWSAEAGIVDAEGRGSLTNLTNSGYEDNKPHWVSKGKAMIWATDRYGLHGDANSQQPQVDIYEMFFTKEAYERFKQPPADFSVTKEREDEAAKREAAAKERAEKEKGPEAKDAPPKLEPVTVDLAGIEDRTARLTLASAQVADGDLTKDGETLVYLAKGDKGFELWTLKPREKELKRLAEFEAPTHPVRGQEFPQQLVLDGDGKNAFVLVDGRLTKVALEGAKQEPVKIAAEKEIDGAAERAYLFEHIWRQVREKFYVTDLHGVDWDYYKRTYARFLPFIDDNRDFAEMASEMLGELNASHTGCRFIAQDQDQTSALGAFFDPKHTGPGLQVAEVIEKGPLANANPAVAAGTIIESIDGTPVGDGTDLSAVLNHKAGKNVALTVFDPNNNNRFTVTTKPIPLGEQEGLLYDRWVKGRRELVDRLSNGTVGYVHVRAMNDESYRDTFAEALGRAVKRRSSSTPVTTAGATCTTTSPPC